MKLIRVVFLVVLFSSYGLIAETEKKVMDLQTCDYPALYNFGDSNSDTGGMAAAFFPMIAPCGDTYFHRPAGRGSDGRLIIDFIAEHLGLPLLSPYLDSVGTNFHHGANFATGGATIRRQNESWFRLVTASDRNRLPRPQDFSKALYTFDIGQNDLAAGFRTMSMKKLRATIPDIINQFSIQIRDLYSKGARTFWIHNTGPIGCLPVATIKVQNPKPGYLDEHGCIRGQNHRAREFNKKLKHSVHHLRAELSEAAITYVDMYRGKYDLIRNAKEQGFEDPFKICCGFHGIGFDVWCGNKATVKDIEVYAGSCAKPSAVISWDGVHYSEAANSWIASQIVNGSLSDPPIPITRACHRKN
ncbi:hypothetical protein ACH5RR_014170 [Cinchona calisaya]|uniref:Uncharacterized protein n=1 Tax=Cinchona calisaya TaxID=153742 RepID=A0ABD3A7Y7_9GENT